MLEQLSQYLVQAPIAVIVLFYIFIADRQKKKIIDSLAESNKELLKTIQDLTRKK